MSFRRARGFTLVELVLGLVVFAAISASFYAVLAQVGARSADPVIQTQAIYIARAYLDEALLRDPDGSGCGSGNRDAWTTIQEFGCIDDQPPLDALGTPLNGLESYRVTVSATNTSLFPGTSQVQVTVTVTHDNAPINLQLTGYRGN